MSRSELLEKLTGVKSGRILSLFDMGKVDRSTAMVIFDIYIAVMQIKKAVSHFDDSQALLQDFRSWDSVIRDISSNDPKQYETVIIKPIQSIDPVLGNELIDSFVEDNRYLDCRRSARVVE